MVDNGYTDWRQSKDLKRGSIMTDAEMQFVNDAICMLNDNVGHMGDYFARWELEEEAYSGDQEELENLPNSRINIITATIEGEICQIVNANMGVMATGVSPEDNEFAEWSRICLDWAISKNKLPKKLTEHERRRNKFGSAWLKVVWNEDFAGGQGLPELKVPPLNKVFIDTKVTSHLDIQEAEYIAETINTSRNYAEKIYGVNKADLIDYGLNQYRDNGVFQEKISSQDDRNWTLIQWWSREDGFLRLREFSGCGILLYDSFKSGTRETQNGGYATNPNNFYKFVEGYPYFFTTKYTKEGELYGFGDAKLLIPLQNCINELYDKLRIQMRPNLILIDSNAGIDVSEVDDNSFAPYYYDGTKTRGQIPVYSIAWGNVSQDMWKLLANLESEAQKITRFSDLMTGQQGAAQTATEAAIQQSQGNAHSEREKMILESTLADVALYMLGLMLEKFKGQKAFRIPGEKARYQWVDFKKMANVPALIPASQSYIDRFKASNPDAPAPEWEHVKGENGKPMTKSVEMDIEVSLGSGLPKNKAFIWQMVEKLGQMMGIDYSSGQPQQKPLLDYKELREFLKNYLGIPIQEEDDEEMRKFMEQFRPKTTPTQSSPMAPSEQPQAQAAANTEGLGVGGGPMTSLSQQEGGVPGGNQPTA